MSEIELPDVPFTSASLAEVGLSRRKLRVLLTEGRIRRVLRGVYARSDLEDSFALRAAALALVVSDHQVVCDRTAAWLHGVDVFGMYDDPALTPVEVCALRGHAITRRAGADGRTRDLRPEDVMRVGGVVVTTPLRTALDLGCALGQHRALGALDQFMRKHGLERADMVRGLVRYAGRRGVVQLRRLVVLADPRSESMRESWLRLDIHDAGLPAPELQFWVERDGVPSYRLDLAYPALRIAIEYDGCEFHRRTAQQIEHDRQRRAWLRAHGWVVIVVDDRSLTGAGRDEWLAELVAALTPRTRRLRWSRPA